MRQRTIVWLLLITVCQSPACTRAPAPQPNILIILIDTLRADRLGAYGSTRGLTPFIDSLAARGYVFRRAYAQSSWTNPSVASLFTSRYQSQHRITWFDSVLSESEVTLTEVLTAHGYVAGGFSANFLVASGWGFGQGFDYYQTFSRPNPAAKYRPYKARARRINREGVSWLDKVQPRRQPIFLYLHYMEPHNPYDPPNTILDKVLSGRPRPDLQRANFAMQSARPNVHEDTLHCIEDLYDAEVMSLDAELRKLFDLLKSRGFLDRAIVVLLADHGEEFKEHGLLGHHKTLYEEVIRIPLIVLVPGQDRRVDVDQIVNVTDLAPTLLDLAGISSPPSFVGHSLAGSAIQRPTQWPGLSILRRWWNRSQAASESTAISELIRPADAVRQSPHEHAIVMGSHKLIAGVNGEREYYNLSDDPAEKTSAGLGVADQAQLRDRLSAFLERATQRAAQGAVRSLDEETKERMRALGYKD